MTPFPVCQLDCIRTIFFYLLMLKGKSHPHLAFMVNQLSLFYSFVNQQMRQLGFILEIIRKELRWTSCNFKSQYLIKRTNAKR